MDQLAEAFTASFAVSTIPNNPAAPHPRFCQYKIKNNMPNQEERRRRVLEIQKQQRYSCFNHARRLAEGDFKSSDSEEDVDNEVEDMEWSTQMTRRPRSYENQLMLSEWLVDVPDDLSENWYLVPCPVGKRSLVVSSQGVTKAYTKSGYMAQIFSSPLPAGNINHHDRNAADHAILDCIWSETDQTYYILDVLSWNSHPVMDCETEFRFFWLQTKVSELPKVKETSSEYSKRFIPVPFYSCERETISAVMNSPLPFSVPLDGLLFYHKHAHYIPGTTPLVGWLKAFMLPEMLEVSVPEEFQEEKPANYKNLKQHVSHSKQQKKKGQGGQNSIEHKMDAESVEKD